MRTARNRLFRPEIVMLSVFITPWTKPTVHPAGNQPRLSVANRGKEAKVRVIRFVKFGVVSSNAVVGELFHLLRFSARGEELERADPYVAGCDTGQHRSWEYTFAQDPLPGRDAGERASSGNSQGMHRFTDQVLSQYWADCGLAVSSARGRGYDLSP